MENKKREWIYCHNPNDYDILCDVCNGNNITWSEFEHKIWCYDCKIDTNGTPGLFNGPISIDLCKMFGISLDRIRLSDGKRLILCNENNKITYKEE
jgi:hypothetical protein